MSIFDPECPSLQVRIPSHRRTLADAAKVQRDVLIILGDIFPDAREWIVAGEMRRLVTIDLSDETAFTATTVELRRTGKRSSFRDDESKYYTPESVPNLHTTMNDYYTPDPVRPLEPHDDDKISWSVSFVLGSSEEFYENIEIDFPNQVGKSREDSSRVRLLMEKLVERLEPEDARYAVVHFDEVFWEADHRIGWLTYFSQPSLVEHLRDDPRSEPFGDGIIVQLSDDPADMMDDHFVKQGFEFAQRLVPYWPEQLAN